MTAIIVLLLIGGFVWWFVTKDKVNDTSNNTSPSGTEVTVAEGSCGEIETEDGQFEGVGPYSPVVKAKINGKLPKDQKICEWTVNGEDFGKTAPYGDYCIRYGLTFYHMEEYKISYTVAGLKDCPKEKTLKVTSLTPEESVRQTAALQKLKDAGMTDEEIKKAENHKMIQYAQ